MKTSHRMFAVPAHFFISAAFLLSVHAANADPSASAFGTLTGTFNNVPSYSNGSVGYDSDQYNSDAGINTGLKWQCVEYVNRYYYSVYSKNLGTGRNAYQFYQGNTPSGLTRFANGGTTAPQVGDILCFNQTGSGLGHVAIIRQVDQTNSKVHVIQQNVKNGGSSPNGTDEDWKFAYSVSGGTYTVDVTQANAGGSNLGGTTAPGGAYYCQGWLRILTAGTAQGIVLQPGPTNGKDIWTTSIYNNTPGAPDYSGPGSGIQNGYLEVGGWGDTYISLLQFDLRQMPQSATSVILSLFFYPDPYHTGAQPVQMNLNLVTSPWTIIPSGPGENAPGLLWWSDQPSVTQWNATPLPAPSQIGWYNIDITALYNNWKNGSVANYGIELTPIGIWNQFNFFHSSTYNDDPSLRPKLIIQSPSPITIAIPANPNIGQRPASLSGHLNYWNVAGNQWVSMMDIPSTSIFDPLRPTIVITHGWGGAISDSWVADMAMQFKAINSFVNILGWDWEETANPAGVSWLTWIGVEGFNAQNLFTNVQMINDAAESARNGNRDGGNLAGELKLIGINPAQTQLIGHSNGGGLMGSAATALYGLIGQKIQRLTTLDSPNCTELGVPINAAQYINPNTAQEVEVYYSSDRLDFGFGAPVSGSNVFNGDIYPTGNPLNPEHSIIHDWYTNLGETATVPHAPAPNVRGMNWSIISPNRPTTWIAEDMTEQDANTGVFGDASFTEQRAETLTPLVQMNFYSGDEYQGTHVAIINDAVRSYVANLWGNSDGYLFKTVTIPFDAAVMTFDMKVETAVSGDYLTVSFGNKVLFCEDITSADPNFVTTLPIPIPDLAGLTDTLLFTMHHDANTPGSSILLDNITFLAYTPPRPMTVDLNHDGIPNLQDFSIFATFWLDTSCSWPGWCEGSDFDQSGIVDIHDWQIFAEFWLWPVPDIDMDHAVNFTDYAIFAGNWMDDTCDAPNWCDGTDFNKDSQVDILDLAEFAEYWLEGT